MYYPLAASKSHHSSKSKQNMAPLRFCQYLCLCILFSLMQYPSGFSLTNNNNTSMINHACRQDESRLLLQLKQQLTPLYPDRYYKTQSWKKSSDCCLWDGVVCDYFTGHVISLDLSSSGLSGEFNPNSSLFHLTHLRKLNLAFNNFSGSTLPSQFGRLKALTHLNLSESEFAGEIPREFYHLSNLLLLDLSENYHIACDAKMLFGNLTRLRVVVLAGLDLINSELIMNMSSFLTHLDLAETGLEGNLPATIFEKPNLQILNLNGNYYLNGSLPKSLNWSNVHSIKELHLRRTGISGRLPDSIGLMTSLNYMDLYQSSFSGPIPESIGNITAITFIHLAVNDFSGKVPSTISNLLHLTSLNLAFNHLEGQLPDAFSSFQNLTELNLRGNNFEGRIPASLTNMSRLINLDISSNAFTGPFPSRAGHGLRDLREMVLSNNSIQGMIPPWLFTLPLLERFDLSSNKFTGQIPKLNSQNLKYLFLSSNSLDIELQSFYNLTSIDYLEMCYNTVTEHVGDDIVNVTLPNLSSLSMSSCGIKEFPNLLRSTPNLYFIDLSNNSIHGPIPTWFTSNPWEHLSSLNLSTNFLTYAGYLPWQSLLYLDLHSNSLRGTFPSSICNMSDLGILNLSSNKLSGNLPGCLVNSSYLIVLDLRGNKFHGKIPTTFGAIRYLTNLGLNDNSLEGPLPPTLANCTRLEVIDLGNNMLQDTFPWWMHTLPELKILILKSNSFHGSITSPSFTNNSFSSLQIFDLSYNNFTGLLPGKLFATLEAIKYHIQDSTDDTLYMGTGIYNMYKYSVILSVKGSDRELTRVMRIFTAIDLSSNNFNGGIPDSISNLTSLGLLNLSHNNIYGSIPPALSRMINLEQLDLSSNQLTGGIPQTLTSLTFLGAFDVSHNHLVGPIPQGNQFLTFSNESYAGNSGLCGAPLTRRCGENKESPSTEEEEEEDDGFMMGFTWKTVVIGYGCGIVLGFILGNVMMYMEKPRWLLRFVYVEAAIIMRRQKKRRRTLPGRR